MPIEAVGVKVYRPPGEAGKEVACPFQVRERIGVRMIVESGIGQLATGSYVGASLYGIDQFIMPEFLLVLSLLKFVQAVMSDCCTENQFVSTHSCGRSGLIGPSTRRRQVAVKPA